MKAGEETAKRQKRVVIATGLFPPDIGGPATYARIVAEQLPEQGFATAVVHFGDSKRFPKGIRHIVYLACVFKAARNADIVYALDPVSTGLPALIAARLAGKHFFVRVAGDYAWEQGRQRFGVTDMLDAFVKKPPQHPFVKMLAAIERAVARRAVRVVVPSEYLKRIVKKWDVPAGNICIVHSVVTPPNITSRKQTLRGILKFQGELLISVGRLVPWKGFAALIETVAELREEFPHVKLFIIGSGPEQEALEQKVSDLGVEGHVVFAGALAPEVLFQYIKAADVFVLNSGYEGFSHQLLEVMHIGTPIVTTDVGGNPELIQDGKQGVLVPYDDRTAIREAVSTLLRDRQHARHLAEKAKRRAQNFTPEQMITELANVFSCAF